MRAHFEGPRVILWHLSFLKKKKTTDLDSSQHGKIRFSSRAIAIGGERIGIELGLILNTAWTRGYL